MAAASWNDDFVDIVNALTVAGVEFVVVGAHALALQGFPRATGDLDILVNPTADNARRTLAALVAFGAPISAHGVTEKDLQTPGTVYQMGLPPRRIDLLTQITGVSFEQAWQGRQVAKLHDTEVPFLGRVELLQNKRATGRPKDLLDVAALESNKGDS